MNSTDKKKEVKNVGILKSKKSKLYPTYIFDKVEDIPYDLIKNENIRLIILDMDNTLIDTKKVYSKKLKAWINKMKGNGVQVYILSNTIYAKTVENLAKEFGVKFRFKAMKPFLGGFKKIAEETRIKKENILMVGDQLFTDVLGGNRFGAKTVLVKPLRKKETFVSKIKRPIEKIVLDRYIKRSGGKK